MRSPSLRPLTRWPVAASALVLLGLAGFVPGVLAGEFKLTETADGVTIEHDGKLVTNYLTRSGSKPVLHPLMSPGGAQLTRNWPMGELRPGEKDDHVHHRGLWLTHGDVNGVDFWLEKEGVGGTIVHRGFGKIAGGPTGRFVAEATWTTPDGTELLDQRSVYEFATWNGGTIIDCDFRLTAKEQPVTFGDTKEGTFGIRVAAGLTVDDKKGGRIVNSSGITDKDAWSKAADWVDYHGPIGPPVDAPATAADDVAPRTSRIAGVAILDHPASFRHPTHWHVRTYGLFAANPFGLHDFGAGEEGAGRHALQPGESLTLRYRVYLHEGDEKQARVADLYQEYAGAAAAK